MRSGLVLALLALGACSGEPQGLATPANDETEVATVAGVEPTEAATPSPLPRPAQSAPVLPERMQALGTEPFWSVEITPGQLRYSHPENIPGTAFAAVASREGEKMRYSGTMDGKAVSLLVQPGTCSDGMSDTIYEWKAELTIDGQTEKGCARKR